MSVDINIKRNIATQTNVIRLDRYLRYKYQNDLDIMYDIVYYQISETEGVLLNRRDCTNLLDPNFLLFEPCQTFYCFKV